MTIFTRTRVRISMYVMCFGVILRVTTIFDLSLFNLTDNESEDIVYK